MSNDETIATLFDLSITAEKKARDFYLGLAKKFSHISGVSEFWKEMLEQETQHKKELENLRNTLTPSQLLAPADYSILVKAKEILRISVEDNLNSVRTLDDAYELAHELEHSEISTVYDFLTSKFSTSKEQRKFIRSELDDHLAKLMTFTKTFGNSEWRKSIIVKNK